MDLFTPGNYNSIVRPTMARQVQGDDGPSKASKPKIPTAQPVNRKSPRKKNVNMRKSGAPGGVAPGNSEAQKGTRAVGRVSPGPPGSGFNDGATKLHLGDLNNSHILHHSPNQASDMYGPTHGTLPMIR